MRRRLCIVLVASVVTVAACGAPTGREVRSDQSAAATDPSSVDAGVAAVNALALDLQRELARRGGNVAIAPVAIATSLAMVRLGARSETRAGMDRVLHRELAPDLDTALATIEAELEAADGERRSATRKGDLRTDQAAAPWLQEETRVSSDYLDELARTFGAGVRLADFRSEPDAARGAINRWAADETDDVVDQLVPRGEVSDDTRFVVASAATVHLPWAVRFDPSVTTDEPFTRSDGREMTVSTMVARDVGSIRSATGDGWRAVELPYIAGGLAMLVVVPQGRTLGELTAAFDARQLDEVVDALTPSPIELRLPKFQFSAVTTLDDELTELGMGDAFSSRTADFSGIAGDEAPAISDVVHGTYAAADEEGSDGDAVTVVPTEAGPTSSPTTVAIDQPFLFVVRDTVSRLILQIGQVVEPQT